MTREPSVTDAVGGPEAVPLGDERVGTRGEGISGQDRGAATGHADTADERLAATTRELKAAQQRLKTYEKRILDAENSRLELRRRLRVAEQELAAVARERDALVGSLAWRITAPLRALRNVASGVQTILGRKPIVLTPEPGSSVEVLEAGGFSAIDPRPQLILPLPAPVRARWALLRYELRADDSLEVEPRVYFDSGSGFDEASPVSLPAPVADVVEGVVRLPAGTERLRLHPLTGPGDFSIISPRLLPLTSLEAVIRLASQRLTTTHGNPRELARLARGGLKALARGGVSGLGERLRTDKALEARRSYDQWVATYDTIDDKGREAIRASIAALVERPRLSVVMPVFNVEPRWLERAIESVRAQLYTNWELCIADDCSTRAGVRETLARYASLDPRIRVTYREKNGHISECSNSALALASGDYVVLMDHDDEIPEHALAVVASEIDAHPDVGLLYSDEDKIDEHGHRYDAYFKCDWNPDLFYSHNMVSHLGVYRRTLVEQVGGFRRGYEGSQDYDLALRMVELLRPEQIRHVPHVLYHWRAIAGSTARAITEKSYAQVASQRAIADHLARRGVRAEVLDAWDGSQYNRVRYELPATPPRVSLVIPTRDRVDLLSQAISSILERTDYPNLEILIGDNQSSEPATLAYFERICRDQRVRVIPYDRPFNFSGINNACVKEATGPVIGLVNNDIEAIEGDWLQEMVSHAMRPEIGVVGAMLWYPDDTIQHAGVVLGVHGVAGHVYKGLSRDTPGYFGRATLIQSYSAVTAACCIVRKSVYDEAGGLDEKLAVAFNDIDFCLRVREKGYRNLWTPYARLYHHESATRGSDLSKRNRPRFMREIDIMKRRWGAELPADPSYSPNLSLDSHEFLLAFPPRVVRPWAHEEND